MDKQECKLYINELLNHVAACQITRPIETNIDLDLLIELVFIFESPITIHFVDDVSKDVCQRYAFHKEINPTKSLQQSTVDTISVIAFVNSNYCFVERESTDNGNDEQMIHIWCIREPAVLKFQHCVLRVQEPCLTGKRPCVDWECSMKKQRIVENYTFRDSSLAQGHLLSNENRQISLCAFVQVYIANDHGHNHDSEPFCHLN